MSKGALGFMRAISVFLMMMTSLLLAGCGDYASDDKAEARSKLYKTIDDVAGVFWRVEASYRVKETGERLDYNYIVSAYNRDVVGSFSGVYFPKVVFKKTKNNGVLAVDAPVYYHEVGFDRPASYGVKDAIPRIAWYPNADDLRYAESYVTSDAYHSPRAAIEFLDFKVTPVTREDSKAWWAEHEKTRDETGTYILPSECERERDKLFFVSKCRDSLSNVPPVGLMAPIRPIVASALVWPRGAFERYKKIRTFKTRFVCHDKEFEPLINKSNRKYKFTPEEMEKKKYLDTIWNEIWNERRPQIGNSGHTGAKRSKAVALGLSDEMMVNTVRPSVPYEPYPVTPVYPVVGHIVAGEKYHKNRSIVRILMQPNWLGFGLPVFPKLNHLGDQYDTLKYKHPGRSAVYINDELICTSPHNKHNFLIYDMELGQSILIKGDL